MFNSLEDIALRSEQEKKEFWEIILEDDLQERGGAREESFSRMEGMWRAMLTSSAEYDQHLTSPSGLSGGDGHRLETYSLEHSQDSLCGSFVLKVMTQALKMGESNACMKRIVAAPTAGACGVLPAVLIPYSQEKNAAETQMVKALYTAAGIGQVIASRAFISGASGGCQAEIGSASAMAAGALVHLRSGNVRQIIHASAIALKSLLGLVCDPVGGLVEVPCIKRNVIGAVNALSSAEMALSGIVSKVPPDQVIDAMKEVGEKMDSSLRETARGGLAATPFSSGLSREAKTRTHN